MVISSLVHLELRMIFEEAFLFADPSSIPVLLYPTYATYATYATYPYPYPYPEILPETTLGNLTTGLLVYSLYWTYWGLWFFYLHLNHFDLPSTFIQTKLHGAFGLLSSSSFVQALPLQSQNQHYPQATQPTFLPFLTIAPFPSFPQLYPFPIFHSFPIALSCFCIHQPLLANSTLNNPAAHRSKSNVISPRQRFTSIVIYHITSINPCPHTPHYLLRFVGV